MNLIEAWKQAKDGQVVKRSSSGTAINNDNIRLKSKIYEFVSENDLLADDWEIVKVKKKETFMALFEDGNSLGAKVFVDDFSGKYLVEISKRANDTVKMTLEWEE